MLKHGVNITDSGYGSDLYTSNSYDDDIELVLQENSTAVPSCKSFWTFGAQAGFLRLFQWVYKIVQRTKAARILHHLDTVPENEIAATIVEVARELCVAFEYQLMMLYSNTEVIKLADHGVVCLITYLNSEDSEFTCASLLQAVLEVKPLTGNKKEIVKTRVINLNGKHYCLCWKLWQVLKQPGLRVQATDLNQEESQNEDTAKLCSDTDSDEVFLAKIHLSLSNAHIVIEDVNDSSELEVQVENNSGIPTETENCIMSDDQGEAMQTDESELALTSEDFTVHEKYGEEVVKDKDIAEAKCIGKFTVDIKAFDFDKNEIDTLQEISNTNLVKFDERIKDVKTSKEDETGVVLTEYDNRSVSITETENHEGADEDKGNRKFVKYPQETTEFVRAVNEEMLDTHNDFNSHSQPGRFNADKVERNSVEHSNCLDEGIQHYLAQNSIVSGDINDVESAAFVSDPYININSVPVINSEQSGMRCVTNAVSEQSMAIDRFNKSKQDAYPEHLSKENVSLSHVGNCTENTSLDSVELLEFGELVSDENDKTDVNGQILDRNLLSDSLHILCDNNGTTRNHSSLPEINVAIQDTGESTSAIINENNLACTSVIPDDRNFSSAIAITDESILPCSSAITHECDPSSTRTNQSKGAITNRSDLPSTIAISDESARAVNDENNHPGSNGTNTSGMSSTLRESNLLRTVEMKPERNGLGSSYTLNNENDIQNTNAVLDENLANAVTDENNLLGTSAITGESIFPNAMTGGSNLPCAIPAASNLSTQKSTSAITDESSFPGENAITDASHLPSASTVTDENNLSDTAIIQENPSYTNAVIEHRSSVSDTNQAAENGLPNTVVGCPNDKNQTKEESDSKMEEEFVSKPQIKQKTGTVFEHIKDEYPYRFYGCFTPYGAKCRPKVYGFRGPLHVWNEEERQFTFVYNDKVTVIDSRARHIPFSEGDKHMVYAPKTCCKH